MQFELHFDSLTRTRVIYYSTVAWFILLSIPYIIQFYLSYRGINLIYIFYHLLCLGNYNKYNNSNNENNLCLSHKSCQVVGWRYVGWMGKGGGALSQETFCIWTCLTLCTCVANAWHASLPLPPPSSSCLTISISCALLACNSFWGYAVCELHKLWKEGRLESHCFDNCVCLNVEVWMSFKLRSKINFLYLTVWQTQFWSHNWLCNCASC